MSKISIVIIFLFLTACNYEDETLQPGVVLTFDDGRNCAEIISVCKQYDFLATIYIDRYYEINENIKKDLLLLQKQGFEIGHHGKTHAKAAEYINNNGIDCYIDNEIISQLQDMTSDGFNISSFAYPCGNFTEESNMMLLKYFKSLRSTTSDIYNKDIFIKNKDVEHNFVYGLRLDDSMNFDDILYVLNKTKKNKSIVVFYAHKPVDFYVGEKCTISIDRIQKIIEYVNNNNMKFYTMSEAFGY